MDLELKFATEMTLKYAKNYQLWYHRRELILKMLSRLPEDFSEAENRFMEQIFEKDSKNYHAWSHRYYLYLLIVHTIQLANIKIFS